MSPGADRNFIASQGFEPPVGPSCAPLSSALRFQPRVVFVIVLLGTAVQLPAIFVALGAVLGWAALSPAMNPFNLVYNATFGRAPDAPRLGPAPAPRRFSMGVAGALCVAIAVSLWLGWLAAARLMEMFLLIATAAVGFARLCIGAFLYYTLHGRVRVALATLPWGREV